MVVCGLSIWQLRYERVAKYINRSNSTEPVFIITGTNILHCFIARSIRKWVKELTQVWSNVRLSFNKSCFLIFRKRGIHKGIMFYSVCVRRHWKILLNVGFAIMSVLFCFGFQVWWEPEGNTQWRFVAVCGTVGPLFANFFFKLSFVRFLYINELYKVVFRQVSVH